MIFKQLFVLVVAMSFAKAAAGCTKDTDCKGDRVCENSVCVAPTVVPVKPVLVPVRPALGIPMSSREQMIRSTKSGAVVAMVGGGSTLIFGATSAATTGELPAVSLISGSLALLSTAILAPVAAGSANKARHFIRAHGGYVGVPGYAIAGWTMYGLGVANGAALVAIGAGEGDVPAGLIVSCTLFGISATAFMAADALSMRTKLHGLEVASAHPKKFRVGVTPVIGPKVQKLMLVGSF